MYFKYLTYYSFTTKYRQKQNEMTYDTWNRELEIWQKTEYQNLREGQIIKVGRYLET